MSTQAVGVHLASQVAQRGVGRENHKLADGEIGPLAFQQHLGLQVKIAGDLVQQSGRIGAMAPEFVLVGNCDAQCLCVEHLQGRVPGGVQIAVRLLPEPVGWQGPVLSAQLGNPVGFGHIAVQAQLGQGNPAYLADRLGHQG